MYSDHCTVKVRSSQEIAKYIGGREESAGLPYGKTTKSPVVSGHVLFREDKNITV